MNKERYHIFDILRGLAIFLMILAHSVYFFHNQSSSIITTLEGFGNSVCYVTFLLVSGAVGYIAYLGDHHINKKRLIKRLTILFVAYFAISFFVLSKEIAAGYGFAKFATLFDIITLRYMPPFMEYIPPFIIYGLALVLFSRFYKKISASTLNLVIVSILLYLIGYIGYKISVPAYFVPWKAILVGSPGFYRFPIFQYFPVYLLGIYWGQYTVQSRNFYRKKSVLLEVSSIIMIILALGIAVSNYIGVPLSILFLRWPPAPFFLLLGILFAFGLTYIIYQTHLLRKAVIIRDFLLLLGQNSLAVFASHIVVLNFYGLAGGAKVGSITMFLIYFFLTIIFSLALATFIPFNQKFNLTFIRKSKEEVEILEHDQEVVLGTDIQDMVTEKYNRAKNFFFPKKHKNHNDRRFIKKRHLLFGSMVAMLASFVALPSLGQQLTLAERETPAPWWSDEYAYMSNISIKNNESFSDIKQGDPFEIVIDHKALVEAKKSKIDGSDVVVVYWTGKKYISPAFSIKNAYNAVDTTIVVRAPQTIHSGEENNNFYLYYGNPVATFATKNISLLSKENKNYTINIKPENIHSDLLKINKVWALKNYGESPVASIDVGDKDIEKAEIFFKNGSEVTNLFQSRQDASVWSAKIDTSSLALGSQKIQARLTDTDGNVFYSQITGFYYSMPFYVNWTQDWEGYDVSEAYLSAIDSIATRYGLKITHFFNPRIYLSGVMSSQRSDYLTNWVKNRETGKGDEIGMHLHMFYDFVRDAGLEPIIEQNWGDNGDGYGSLTTNYNQSQISQIMSRALYYFDQKGIKKPLSYRAGGWYANLDTLKAEEENGFLNDSSGRTPYNFGRNNIKGPWELKETSLPYNPSLADQNKAGSPSLTLLEIPDNGADSYKFSAEEMISRFDKNYSGGVVESFGQITFITHPHWFADAEQQKIKTLFNKIDNFSYIKDDGPVVFSTIAETGKAFKESK